MRCSNGANPLGSRRETQYVNRWIAKEEMQMVRIFFQPPESQTSGEMLGFLNSGRYSLLFRLHFRVATIACGSLGKELVDISLAAKHEQ